VDGSKPFAAVAEKVSHWLVYGNGQRAQCKDVVARWRDWCDSEPDHVPLDRPAIAGGNVHPLRAASRFDRAQEGLRLAYEDAIRRENEAKVTG
jgi:hypothetical protein